MFIRRVFAVTLAALALGSTASAAIRMDGKLPVYPKVTPIGFSFSDKRIQDGMAMGVARLTMNSSDSVSTVDAWYRGKLSSCKRDAGRGGILYTCSGGEVKIGPSAGGSRILVAPDPS